MLVTIAAILLFQTAAWSGESGIRLRCSVVDESKAVVKDATLQLQADGTNFSVQGVTDERGEYTFVNIPPGTYALTISKDEFAPETMRNIALDLNEVRVLSVALKVSAAKETVFVTTENVNIVPQQTFLRGLVDPMHMMELPLNGRNFTDLIYTQPGVTRDTSNTFGTGHAVDGARTSANSFLIDGSDDNDAQVPLTPALNINTSGIPLDALDEFSVITTNATADYGRSSGAIVNLATRSGTEKMHGTLWEFLRNDVLDSRTFFDSPGQKEPFKQNLFGGHLGGGYKQTFFSVAYEGYRQRQQVPIDVLVPSASFLASVTNPSWKGLLQGAYPAANLPGPSSNVGIFNSAFNNGRDQDTGFVRLDRSFGQAHRTFVSMAVNDGNQILVSNGVPGTGTLSEQRNWNVVASDNWMIRPTFYNTFHFSVNRVSNGFSTTPLLDTAPQSGTFRTAGPFAGQPFDTALNSSNGFPSLILSTGAFTSAGPATFVPEAKSENTFQTQDSIAWITHKHQITAGADLRRLQDNRDNETQVRPLMIVDSSNLANLQSGFVLSQVQNFYVSSNLGERGYRNWEADLFVSDSYRVSTRLTLDYGLRYEDNTPPSEVRDHLSNAYVMQNGKPMACQSLPVGAGMQNVAVIVPSQFGIGLYCADRTNFAPRAGFAWDVFGNSKTVVRGAYGVFYDPIYGTVLQNFRTNAPFVLPTQIGGFAYNGQQASSTLTPTSVIGVNSVDPGLRTPRTQRWHLTLSRELSKNTVVNASYVGATANHLPQYEEPNFGPAFADAFRPSNGSLFLSRNPSDLANNVITGPFGAVENLTTAGYSNYHALQLELIKRYSSGLTMQASYTWSHSLDTISDILNPSQGTDSASSPATVNNLLAPLFAPGSSCPGAFSVATPVGLRNAVACATGNNTLTIDQAAAIFASQFISAANVGQNYGDSAFDVRQRFVANAIYELPIGRNKPWFNQVKGITDKLVSGWQMASIVEAQTGAPLPIYAGTDANFDGDNNDRAVLTGPLSSLQSGSGAQQFQCTATNPVTRACTAPFGQGLGIIDPSLRLGRGAVRAPGIFNLDASVLKHISISERYSVQFRAEFFNLLNNVNFAAPVQQINNPSFGTSNGQLLINNTQSRQIQFGLKLQF